MGINPDRLHIDWASAGEGNRFANIVDDFIYKVIKLGPCEIKYVRL